MVMAMVRATIAHLGPTDLQTTTEARTPTAQRVSIVPQTHTPLRSKTTAVVVAPRVYPAGRSQAPLLPAAMELSSKSTSRMAHMIQVTTFCSTLLDSRESPKAMMVSEAISPPTVASDLRDIWPPWPMRFDLEPMLNFRMGMNCEKTGRSLAP